MLYRKFAILETFKKQEKSKKKENVQETLKKAK